MLHPLIDKTDELGMNINTQILVLAPRSVHCSVQEVDHDCNIDEQADRKTLDEIEAQLSEHAGSPESSLRSTRTAEAPPAPGPHEI